MQSKEGRYHIVHEREKCISCKGCSIQMPRAWKMNPQDGRSMCVRPDFNESVLSQYKEVAEVCPAHCIHIKNMATKKFLEIQTYCNGILVHVSHPKSDS